VNWSEEARVVDEESMITDLRDEPAVTDGCAVSADELM